MLLAHARLACRSGDHIEDHQNARNEQSAAGEDDPMQKKKKEEEVDAYMFYSQVEGGETSEVPMFLVAYEEVYAQPEDPSKDPSEIVAIRVWKFVRRRFRIKLTSLTQPTPYIHANSHSVARRYLIPTTQTLPW